MPGLPNFIGSWASAGPRGGSGAHRGAGPYGLVPGDVPVPENIWSQVGRALPNFSNLISGATANIGSELSGDISQATRNALARGAAEFGISSGMPGSGVSANNLLGNIAGFSEKQQRQGMADLESLTSLAGGMQTDPRLAYEVSDRNAMFDAAPDPQMAAEQANREYDRRFAMAQAAGRGGGGGMYPNWSQLNSRVGAGVRPSGGWGETPAPTGGAYGAEPMILPSGGEGYWSGGSYITPGGGGIGGTAAATPFSPGGYGGGSYYSGPMLSGGDDNNLDWLYQMFDQPSGAFGGDVGGADFGGEMGMSE